MQLRLCTDEIMIFILQIIIFNSIGYDVTKPYVECLSKCSCGSWEINCWKNNFLFQGWEETVNSNIAYLLRTCLAKSVKEQNSEFGAFFCCCLCFTSALLSRRFQPSLLFGMKCDRNKQHFDVLCARTYSPELSVILKNIVSINLTPYSIYPRHLF